MSPQRSLFTDSEIEQILDGPAFPSPAGRLDLGVSREKRPLVGFLLGSGSNSISAIGGCHADEPVGPAMLDRLVAWLQGQPPGHPLLRHFTWRLVPHANPDGEARNARWTDLLGPAETWTRREPLVTVPFREYCRHVVRELPGDDLEFGFPRDSNDRDARPEAQAIAQFLAPGAPFLLHGSFHGMAFAAGPWFLIERAWVDRSGAMRDRLRERVHDAGYPVHDIDRHGDKGFERIDRGFTTRPDSRAMIAHFEAAGDFATARLFRPSSMEFVRSLGGDPFTLVSEMPLFRLPPSAFPPEDPIRPPASRRLRESALGSETEMVSALRDTGMEPMPLRHQMRFQLELLAEALLAAATAEGLSLD